MAVPGQDPVPVSPVPPLSVCPMPQAIAERAHGGLSCVGLNYNQEIQHAKAAHCHGSYCCCKSCNILHPVSHSGDLCWSWLTTKFWLSLFCHCETDRTCSVHNFLRHVISFLLWSHATYSPNSSIVWSVRTTYSHMLICHISFVFWLQAVTLLVLSVMTVLHPIKFHLIKWNLAER